MKHYRAEKKEKSATREAGATWKNKEVQKRRQQG